MTEDRWADLERLAKAATQGGRHVDRLGPTFFVYVGPEPLCRLATGRRINTNKADAAFIAAANPAAILELIAAARAGEAGQ